MSINSNDNSTAHQYKPASNQSDRSAGIMESKIGGTLSYQMGNKEQGLSEQLGGHKLSESLKLNGKLRVGPDMSGFESIGPKSYTPDSKEALGVSAVSATGHQHTFASQIKADSVLTINGIEAQAESLHRAGLIGKDVNGNYLLPGIDQDTQQKKV